MSKVSDLLALQVIDGEIAALRASLAAVEARIAGDPELDEARATLAAADGALRAVQREQRRLEGEVADLSARIAPEEKRLYDGSVRNAKELTNIQHELELLKASRAKIEDGLVEVLAEAEAAERDAAAAREAAAERERSRSASLPALESELRALAAAILRAEEKRRAQQATLDARSLQIYEDLCRRRAGVAVARVRGSSCGSCRIAIPEGLRARAMAGLLVYCPSCERILHPG